MRNAGIIASGLGSYSYPVVFQDNFDEASTTMLTLHRPNIGKYWDAPLANDVPQHISVSGGNGYAAANATINTKCAYALAGHLPTSADCEVEVVVSHVAAAVSTSIGIYARYVNANGYSYCALMVYNGASSRIYLYKVSASPAAIGTYNVSAWVVPFKLRLKCAGSTISVLLNDVEIISVVDTDVPAAGFCGIVVGRYASWTYTMNTDWQLDSFTLTESGGTVAPHRYVPVFQDTFFDVDNTALVSHTPDLGTSWTIATNPGSLAITISVTASLSGYNVNYVTCGAALTQKAIALANPAPSTADVEVSSRFYGAGTYSNACQVLIARYQDLNNFYCAVIYYASNTSDCQIWKVSGGVATKLGSVDAASTTEVSVQYKFVLIGTSLKLYRSMVEILAVTDSSFAGAGYAGIGWGNIVVAGDRIFPVGFSKFTVREIYAS